MQDFSLTQTGNYAAFAGVIVWAFHFFKISVSADEVVQAIGAIVTITGIVTSWIGRYRQGDITVAGFKKPQE